MVVRVEAGLFFANADYIRQHIRSAVDEHTRAVVLDGETSPTIDVTATEMLAQLAHDLDRDGIALFVARDIGQVRDVIRAESTDSIVNNIYPTVDAAVSAARELPSRG